MKKFNNVQPGEQIYVTLCGITGYDILSYPVIFRLILYYGQHVSTGGATPEKTPPVESDIM